MTTAGWGQVESLVLRTSAGQCQTLQDSEQNKHEASRTARDLGGGDSGAPAQGGP